MTVEEEFASLIPLLTDDEYRRLEESILQKEFSYRDAEKLWMLQNQLSRRNLSDFQRIEMVRKCEDTVKIWAKERQLSGLTQIENPDQENLPEREMTEKQSRDELEKMEYHAKPMNTPLLC